MLSVRADLHLHTVLSPCGDLEMAPANILRIAEEKGLDIIGITDHNSTRQAAFIRQHNPNDHLFILAGAEVTTQEEVHCLAFFSTQEQLDEFQAYLDAHLPPIANSPEKFGYQVAADFNDQIIYEEPRLLISALDQDLEKVRKKVKQLQGIFIPAHIDKARFSILSQLGFIPSDLEYDALEISCHANYQSFLAQRPELRGKPFIQSSDAHYPADIGKVYTVLEIEELSFEAIRRGINRHTPAIF